MQSRFYELNDQKKNNVTNRNHVDRVRVPTLITTDFPDVSDSCSRRLVRATGVKGYRGNKAVITDGS